jgi:predicted nucleotidyltransferase component of viral defense system
MFMDSTYPKTFEEITHYVKTLSIPDQVARQRFAQYGILKALSYSKILSESLVLKGGNALDCFWAPNRSTRDIDFSSIEPLLLLGKLETTLNPIFNRIKRELGTTYKLQNGNLIEDPNEPGGPSFEIIKIQVAYALKDEYTILTQLESGNNLKYPHPNIIPVEMSTNECVCETIPLNMDGQFNLRLSSLEDIMAEKLRCLLQQVNRSTTRKQDVLDLAFILQSEKAFEKDKVAKFLKSKAPNRNVTATKDAFRNPKVRESAQVNYNTLIDTAKVFISFDIAFDLVMDLVDNLDI